MNLIPQNLLCHHCTKLQDSVHVEKAQSLIANGANVNEVDKREANGDGGNSPLWYAAQGLSGGGVSVAQLLVQAGADVNAKGEFGMTPLHMACSWGHPDMVTFLYEHGADLSAKDDYGRTPVALARADYEEGKSTANPPQPDSFTTWLEGMATINRYFERLPRETRQVAQRGEKTNRLCCIIAVKHNKSSCCDLRSVHSVAFPDVSCG